MTSNMMTRFGISAIVLLALLPAHRAEAHGTPIVLGQSSGQLIVSGGLSDSEGFASQIYVEDDEDGDPFASVTLPNVGPVIIWQLPGFNIAGLNNESSLSIEVVARPAPGTVPQEARILWYWSPQSQCVEPAESDFYLLGTGMRHTTIPADGTVAPTPFLLAASLSGHQGFHNHGLLSYALDNNPPPAAGAYGFFARLISNQYAPSDPILIVVNHGVDYEQMVTAALAINSIAADLDGDFNDDGAVDAADYVEWRKSIGTAPEYETWRTNFGATGEGCDCGCDEVISVVPEPTGLVLAAAGVVAAMAVVGSLRGARQHAVTSLSRGTDQAANLP
jgi:hypothetical protein